MHVFKFKSKNELDVLQVFIQYLVSLAKFCKLEKPVLQEHKLFVEL